MATLSADRPGFPFASLVPIALDRRLRPILLLSRLALHTKNIDADPRCSLLIASIGGEDPQAAARLTLVGRVRTLAEEASDAAEHADAREAYLARHPRAADYFSIRACWAQCAAWSAASAPSSGWNGR